MKTPVSHQLTMTVLMTPDMANFSGNVHWRPYPQATRPGRIRLRESLREALCRNAFRRQVVFRQPIHVGELVTFLASVNYTGTTSMEVGIKVVTENIQTQLVRHANSCFFTMVAVNEDGRPVQIPPRVPATADERRRFEAAKTRRELRRELEARYVAMKAPASASGAED